MQRNTGYNYEFPTWTTMTEILFNYSPWQQEKKNTKRPRMYAESWLTESAVVYFLTHEYPAPLSTYTSGT